MISVTIVGCGKKKKLTYGDTEGVVSGNITFSDEGAEFDLDNVKAPAGTDIDYTSGIVTSGEGEDYSVEVNASSVKYDKPGTYTASYTVTSGSNTYTDNIKVTITDKKQSSENYEQSADEAGVGDDAGQNNAQQGGTEQNEGSQNQGQQNQAVPNNQAQNNSNGNSQNHTDTDQNSTQPTSKKVLITNESITYKNKNIPNAVIELLSGDVVTISCSTNKYIVSTRTEETQVQKNGHTYKTTKLIVTFNTGKEQTLETIEKRMD